MRGASEHSLLGSAVATSFQLERTNDSGRSWRVSSSERTIAAQQRVMTKETRESIP